MSRLLGAQQINEARRRAAGLRLGVGLSISLCSSLAVASASPPENQAQRQAEEPVARPPRRGHPAPAVAAANAFGFALYPRIRTGEGNAICSPASASIVLTMAWAGARGATQRQMSRVLSLGSTNAQTVHGSFAALLGALNDPSRDGVTLHVADRLWGQKDLDFRADYLRLLDQRYGAALESVDFVHATEQARGAINRWAATETHDRIPEVLRPGDLTSSTRLVLTNAAYLKAAWVVPFPKERTSNDPFTTPAGNLPVPMMHAQLTSRYARVPDAQLVELDYRGDLSMVVVLPDRVDGLDLIEGRLASSYQAWTGALEHTLVDVALPRWTVRSRMALSQALAAMGMASAFSPAANFSGMAGSRPLFIDQILQEAFVTVDEEGTEAAVVTAGVVRTTALMKPLRPPIPFHVDHPFLYLIRDKKTGVILFIGRVVDPR